MLPNESPYDFRKRMLNVNPSNINDGNAAEPDEFTVDCGCTVGIPADDPVVYTAAKDFCDFMLCAMNTPVMITHDISCSVIQVNIDPLYKSCKCYKIDTCGKIIITSHDSRGAQQAFFRLEEIMCERRAPCIKTGSDERSPLYSPRMIHSGYGLDNFPNEHLLQIAKAGMDAILLFVTGIDSTPRGYLDFNELIYRASLYGIDVYAYSYMRVFAHPDEPDAKAKYDNVYGELFRHCPGLHGVVFVGESVGFPTRDPDASPNPYYSNSNGGIPTGKPSADMWPCKDYKEWLALIQEIITSANPNADIVFWTYNWGNAPRENRISLIKSLPKGISLLVTYEMFHKYNIGGTVGHCADYTLSFAGPGDYFTSEAEAAHECGIRLYAMTNTGGLTWDMGVIPYEPMPYQWIKRYKTMREAHDKWGLCGLMESHHYGFWPSFISQLARQAFEEGSPDYDAILAGVLKRNFGSNAGTADKALKIWSEAITYYTPTNEDQYGAFRIGPMYPFNLGKTLSAPTMPPSTGDFTFPKYPIDNVGKGGLSAMRIHAEIQSLDRMLELIKQGQELLETCSDPNTELEYLINFGRFLVTYVTTGVNAKRWYLLTVKLQTSCSPDEVNSAVDEALILLQAEKLNVDKAAECVKADSRLGWEPRMEYRATVDQLNWKKRQLDYVINTELAAYRRSLTMTLDDVNVIADNFTM